MELEEGGDERTGSGCSAQTSPLFVLVGDKAGPGFCSPAWILWEASGRADNNRYDHSGDCQHFLASAAGPHGPVPAGTIRLVPSKGKLTRLAVLKEYRSHGAGAELVRAMEDWLVHEVRKGKLAHLVNDDGRHGKSVHVKVHSQVSRRERVVGGWVGGVGPGRHERELCPRPRQARQRHAGGDSREG